MWLEYLSPWFNEPISSTPQVLREGMEKNALNFLHDSFFIRQINTSEGSLGEGSL